MHSPLAALTWDIWLRKRGSISWALALTLVGCFFNLTVGGMARLQEMKSVVGLINAHLFMGTLLLLLSVFGYAEFNPRKGAPGFPNRLFILPVTTFRLVALPVVLGVVVIDIVCLAWLKLAFATGELPIMVAVLIGAYVVVYQTIEWALGRLGATKFLIQGILAVIVLFFAGLSVMFPNADAGIQVWNVNRVAIIAGMAVSGFLISWIYVARERSGGGGSSRFRAGSLVDRVADHPARRRKAFASPMAAQFWYEWRRCGLVLPLLIAGVIIFGIVPLYWYVSDEAGANTLRILLLTLAMPIVFSAPVGKAFSKPDFWSGDLTIPPAIAVKPLSASDLVMIKMKVAAASAAISWLVVLLFLSLWLPLWANPSGLSLIRLNIWQAYGHSIFPEYAIAVLTVLAGVFLTWRFLVIGLWLGYSGNMRLYMASTIQYGILVLFGLPAFAIFVENDETDFLPQLPWY
jgi:hypothetical protein